MTNLVLTDHAVLRLAQRGIVPSDLDLIMAIGSEVEDGFLVLKKDIQVVEHALRAILKIPATVVVSQVVAVDEGQQRGVANHIAWRICGLCRCVTHSKCAARI